MRHAQGAAPVPHRVVMRIASEAVADPSTVRKVINGRAVRGSVKDRITRSLNRRGITPLPTTKETT